MTRKSVILWPVLLASLFIWLAFVSSNIISERGWRSILFNPFVRAENLDDLEYLNVESVINQGMNTEEPFTFAILGDTQKFNPDKPNDAMKKAVTSIETRQPSLVMTVGDLISNCDAENACKKRFEQWKNMLGPLYFKTFTVMGNHDHKGNAFSEKIWQDQFVMPSNGPAGLEELVYSFDYGNSHFIVLNSEVGGSDRINQPQREWLEADLAANTKTNTFVFFHQPAFPMATKIDSSLDTHKKERDQFWEIIDRHNVTAVFNGHEHVVSLLKVDKKIFPKAKNDVWQVNVGATDADTRDHPDDGEAKYYYSKKNVYTLVTVQGSQVKIEFFSNNGNLVKTFNL